MAVLDNSGAREALCIGILGGGSGARQKARVGDRVTVVVKAARKAAAGANSSGSGKAKGVLVGSVVRALVVRTKNDPKSEYWFGENGVVLRNAKGEPIGSRATGIRDGPALYAKQRWKVVARNGARLLA